MADTAHKTDEELIEHFDPPDVLDAKLDKLASWVREAQNMTAFTGAGISTSTGIPDFRGPDGIWTMKAQGRKPVQRDYSKGFAPSAGHMALVALLEAGRLQHVISTNTDGLHRKSGLPANRLTEIHGNTNLEDCPTSPVGASENPYAGNGCGRKYFRDGICRRTGLQAHEHSTGRTCACGNPLQDTIINFNENLRSAEVKAARAQAAATDLMLCVGSSLRISNWAPMTVAKNPHAKLVVINLQWTPLNDSADMVIHARSDDVLSGLLDRLTIQPRQFRLTRHMTVRAIPVDLGELSAAAAKAGAKSICGALPKKNVRNSKSGRDAAIEQLTTASATAVAVEIVCTDRDGVTPDAFMKAATVAGPCVPRGHVVRYCERAAVDPSKIQLLSKARLIFVRDGRGDEAELTISLSGRHGESDIVVPIDVSTLLSTPVETRVVLSYDNEARVWIPSSQPSPSLPEMLTEPHLKNLADADFKSDRKAADAADQN